MQNLQNENNQNEKIALNGENSFEYDFSKYKNLEDFNLDEELLEKFKPIAKKLGLNQEAIEMLMDIAYQMSKKQDDFFKNDLKNKHESQLSDYSRMFDEDKELPQKNSPRLKEFMQVADSAYQKFASEKLKETFKELGLVYNPELIKMFYKIGELMREDSFDFDGSPRKEELSPAEILYGANN